jgi:outer membrane protein assembly factor BamB
MKFLPFLLLFAAFAQAQTDTLRCTLLYEIPKKAERVEMDKLGQIYTFSGNAWTKYDINGKQSGIFSEYGATADDVWDLSDPQKIVFFQPAFQKGVVLDRTMNADFYFNFNTNTGAETSVESRNISFVATASDSKLWAIDTYTNTILKLDKNGNNVLNNNFLDRNKTLSMDCTAMMEVDNRLYVQQRNMGVLVFDVFGMLLKTIAIKDLQHFNIINGQLIAFDNEKILTFDTQTGKIIKTSVVLLDTKNAMLRFVKGKIVVYTKEKTQIFNIDNKL